MNTKDRLLRLARRYYPSASLRVYEERFLDGIVHYAVAILMRSDDQSRGNGWGFFDSLKPGETPRDMLKRIQRFMKAVPQRQLVSATKRGMALVKNGVVQEAEKL